MRLSPAQTAEKSGRSDRRVRERAVSRKKRQPYPAYSVTSSSPRMPEEGRHSPSEALRQPVPSIVKPA